jgi:uncharacterized protein (TIGR02246 family)
MTSRTDNEALIDSLVRAYNNHDARGFADHFSHDAIHGNLHGADIDVGTEAIYRRYVDVFGRFPQNATEVVYRVVFDDVIVDHERVSRSPESEPFDVVAVNTIRDGKIIRLDFIRNPTPPITSKE